MSQITVQANAAQILDPSRSVLLFDDFISDIINVSVGSFPWAVELVGAGSSVEVGSIAAQENSAFGVLDFILDDVVVPMAASISPTTQVTPIGVLGAGRVIFQLRIKTPAALRTVTEEYSIYAGLGRKNFDETIPTEGVFFQYSADSTFWQAKTSAVATTTVTSAVTVVANTWYTLRAEINDAGTSVSFFVNGVLIGTSVTNIPNNTGTYIFNPMIKIAKTATAGDATTMLADYYMIQRFFNPVR